MKRRTGLAAFLGTVGVTAAGLMAACGSTKSGEIQQPAWHLLSAREVSEGMEVEIAGENLLLKKGVRITADSQENEGFSAKLAADGISDEDSLRWSSENDWEDNEHWLQVQFPQETQIGYVKIFWERTNACAYALEYSQDGKSWTAAVSFDSAPEMAEQNIRLETPVMAKYLRLHVTDVTKDEADLNLYYQNISILEMEVYEGVQNRFVVERPQIESGSGRSFVMPLMPEGYEITFGGADYENLITREGEIADTLSDVTVEAGFILKKEDVSWELPGMDVEIPASSAQGGEGSQSVQSFSGSDGEQDRSGADGAQPAGVMEWKASDGVWLLPENLQLAVAESDQDTLYHVAELFAKELTDAQFCAGISVAVVDGKNLGAKDQKGADTAQNGVISLALSGNAENSLGEEGYEIRVEDRQITILGNTAQGVRWGCVTLLDWMEQAAGEAQSDTGIALQEGIARDYPKYSVRGFGIDVGRRAISLDLLYQIVEELSAQKMNTLQIHLNDNQIIAQSEYDGTVKGARKLYAGFRLESDIANEDGEGITSQDLFYTKEEFTKLIETAAAYGVEIVPEIDTPAHSLALTKVFPELGFSKDPESVDQLDLSKDRARQLVKDIWREYLTADENAADGSNTTAGTADSSTADAVTAGSTFENCTALHLGMDEYYGKDTAYVEYLEELSAYVQELAPKKELRIWGSLSKVEADYSGVSRELQMHVWDTDWADPQDMYEEGFSIINSLSSSLYIIPGGGYDELDTEFLNQRWEPNLFLTTERDWELPAWSERMLGACYMMWNDWSWMNGDEITEESLFERFSGPLPILADKLWGEN